MSIGNPWNIFKARDPANIEVGDPLQELTNKMAGTITTTTGTGLITGIGSMGQQAMPKQADAAPTSNVVNIRIEKVANGYTVEIIGTPTNKKWVVGDKDDLASIITAALIDRKMG
jgi:hypothetical protein